MYAEIIIPLALPKNYTWEIPEKFNNSLQPGCRVEVNLGKNKKYAGIVKLIHNYTPTTFEPKEILNILDVEPVVQPYQLKFWRLTYDPVPEGALAPNIFIKMQDTLEAGQPLDFKILFKTVLVIRHGNAF